jgi:hypothetical protein
MEEGSNALLFVGRTLGKLALVTALAMNLVLPGTAGGRILSDRIDRAPLERTIKSPDGHFRLSVNALDGWKTPRAVATLRDATGHVRWRKTLPHEGGPRAIVVNNKGAALFVDEWINVIPRHALMVVAPSGKIVGDHPGESVLTLLSVPRRTIGDLARVGPWRSSDAMLSADGQSASLRSGGRTVTISLVNGAVRVGD